MFKLIVVLFFLAILMSLAGGMFYLRKESPQNKVVISLSIRIGLSIFLFALIVSGYYSGWIEPNNILRVKQ